MKRNGIDADFSLDDGEEQFFAGYLKGVSDYVSTSQYIGSAVDYAYAHLKERFEIDMDSFAAMHTEQFHHVYEWGSAYGDKSTVGNPKMRLWQVTARHQGSGIGVGFTFLPSVRDVPLHPKEIKYNVEARHTFTWKAPVMEFGQTVVINPEEALKGKLVFYWEKINEVVATTKTITTKLDERVQGKFTGYFLKWWATDAVRIYSQEVRPQLEKQVVPRGPGGQFAKGRTKEQSRGLAAGGVTQRVSLSRANQAKGEAEAIKDMKRIAAGYKQGRGGWENYRD